jgi:GNAT superfamily N-acetyltransferase
MHPVLDNLHENEFLTGPDPDGEIELDVDPIFGKKWAQVWTEMQTSDPEGLLDDEDGVVSPSDVAEGYQFRLVRAGLLLIDPAGQPVGGYLSCDVSIDTAHQGKGLGTELIVEYFLRKGDIPTWSLDTPAYTPDGERAHRSAYRMIRNKPELINRKLARLEADVSGATPSVAAKLTL